MDTKAISAVFLLSLVLFAYVTGARNDPGSRYWKSLMNDEELPKAITDLLYNQTNFASGSNMKMDRFVRNFSTDPVLIIYHSQHRFVHSEKPP
ncbi:hypothetical protein CASFOL_004801 [Castilleja foliolosa]|uniref:Organ specific protein n=1 Tax=Castilleja foliolosa TaxID=1961234 RepID=A0ABD3EFJ7_9LAMI